MMSDIAERIIALGILVPLLGACMYFMVKVVKPREEDILAGVFDRSILVLWGCIFCVLFTGFNIIEDLHNCYIHSESGIQYDRPFVMAVIFTWIARMRSARAKKHFRELNESK
ncbi:hypothetical protein ACFL1X_02595 [Candidatus Hydrogenedentota bacterium]